MKKITHGGFYVALGVLFPIIFHFFGGTGPVFLPMHIPVLLAGLFLGSKYGGMVGVLTPVLSSFLTGMPPIPILYFMTLELGAYGFFAGLLYQQRTMKVLRAVLFTMIFGRGVLALSVFILQPLLGLALSPSAYLVSALVSGVPGMLIQLIFVPLLVKTVERVGVYEFGIRN